MDRPVMPTWRERGAHPRSVTFLVAAELGPQEGGERAQLLVFLRRHPRPHADHHLGAGQRLDVVVAALGQHPDAAPRPGASASRREPSRCSCAGDRQHPGPDRDHLCRAACR